jgi:hypothetical protein
LDVQTAPFALIERKGLFPALTNDLAHRLSADGALTQARRGLSGDRADVPDRRRLELFARPPARPGWTAIGLNTAAEAAAFRQELRGMNSPAPDEENRATPRIGGFIGDAR